MRLRVLRVKNGYFEKRCSTCRQWLRLPQFNRNRTTRDGFQRLCRECQATANKVVFEQNRKLNEYRRGLVQDTLAATIEPELVKEYKSYLKRKKKDG